MLIQIDYRETDLLKNIQHLIETNPQFKDLEISTENLPLGDVLFVEKGEKDHVHLLIERKSLGDLVASIKDGRYEEQSYRLNGLDVPNHNILYLIEGDINKRNFFKENKEEKRMIYSSLFSLNYYKGFSVIRTLSLEETALYICYSAHKLIRGFKENKAGFYRMMNTSTNSVSSPAETSDNTTEEETPVIDTKSYVNVIKKVKKENITPENIGEILLSQIPGIRATTAIAIMKHFQSIAHLIETIQKDKECLKGISYLDHKGKPRKISSTCIQNLYLYLGNGV